MSSVHKDFHGAMSYARYLCEKYGEKGMVEYLKQLAHTLYSPLTEALKTRGLLALYEHWDCIFTTESADFEVFNLPSFDFIRDRKVCRV